MPIDHLKKTLRSNGEVIIEALKKMDTPATLKEVVEYLATNNDLDATQIRAPVREILNTGYNIGFLAKRGGKYTLANVSSPSAPEPQQGPSDRSRSTSRRRRSRSKSRKRSRSKSRKRSRSRSRRQR